MKKNIKIIFSLLVSCVSIIITEVDGCSDISNMIRAKESKIQILSMEQYPTLKLKNHSVIDSVILKLDVQKFLLDAEKKRRGEITSLAMNFFREINFSQKIFNASSHLAIIEGFQVYFDTTYSRNYKEILHSLNARRLKTNFETKLKLIQPGSYDRIVIRDTITFLKNDYTWLNFIILYRNSSFIYYYKYYAVKILFRKFKFPITLFNKIKQVPEAVIPDSDYSKIVSIKNNSSFISNSDFRKLKNF